MTWCDRPWLYQLNQHNVLNYFADKNNIFYDHTCNNEHIRMLGRNPSDLERMKGVEYVLLQAQEPILYVIRKQERFSPTNVAPLANYYIIAGVIHQAPDLKSIVESKLLTAIYNLQSAFEECFNYARFHPSVDYQWSFDRDFISSNNINKDSKENADSQTDSRKGITQRKEIFITDANDNMRAKYRQSVDALIADLYFKFPPPEQKATFQQQQAQASGNESNNDLNENTKSHEKVANQSEIVKTQNDDDGYDRGPKSGTKNSTMHNKKMKI